MKALDMYHINVYVWNLVYVLVSYLLKILTTAKNIKLMSSCSRSGKFIKGSQSKAGMTVFPWEIANSVTVSFS